MILPSSNPVCARVSGFWRNQHGDKGDMARRSENWNVGLAHDLRDSKVAQELLSPADERLPVQVALGKMVRAMDVRIADSPH